MRPDPDMRRGVESGRFRSADLNMIWSFVDGAMTGALNELCKGELDDEAVDLTAEIVLCSLGIDPEEAALIAHRPLEPR